jgi:hypothetical protein
MSFVGQPYLGCRGEEVCAVLPGIRSVGNESEPCFVDERFGLKGLAGSFIRHARNRQLAEFLVNQWNQFIRSLPFASWIA